MIVGVSSIDGLFHAKNSWPQARVVLGVGRDGADHALLDVLDHEDVGARFSRVVIVSGDGIFANAAAELARQASQSRHLDGVDAWRRACDLLPAASSSLTTVVRVKEGSRVTAGSTNDEFQTKGR